MPDYIKTADLHAALARVRDETKAKVWAEAYAAGQKAEQDQYAKAIQLVTLGRALGGLPVNPQAVVTQAITPDPVEEIIRETKAFADNPALPRRENPDGPAYGKLLQFTEGWVHPDGAVTVLNGPGESHVAALAEADPGVSQAFHASLARHAHRPHPGGFVDDDVKAHAFDKGFVHISGKGRTIEATGKHEMLLKHRKFLKDLAMRSTTLVFRPVDGDDYEVKAKADRTNKAIPANPCHRTENVVATHHVIQDALSRGDTHYANQIRGVHADALDDAGADREAAVERVIAGQQPASHLAATFRNAANLKLAARSRTEAAHTATEAAYEGTLQSTTEDGDDYWADHAHRAFDRSHDARGWSRLGEFGDAGRFGGVSAGQHDRAAAEHETLSNAELHADNPDGVINHEAVRHHTETAALHRHAAEQHRVAAAYNAAAHHADSQRTVKAVHENVAKMEHHEGTPGVFGNDENSTDHPVGNYDEDNNDLKNPSHSAYHRTNHLLDRGDSLGVIGKVLDRHLHLENAHEKALDAADMGDEPGRRYWHRRARDFHLLAADAYATEPFTGTGEGGVMTKHLHPTQAPATDYSAEAAEHVAAAELHGRAGRDTAGPYDDTEITAAHLIAHHKGDVGAAARHASEAAIKATDPDILEPPGESIAYVGGGSVHTEKWRRHERLAAAIRTAPDTYRPLTLHDIDVHETNDAVRFYRPTPTPTGTRHNVLVDGFQPTRRGPGSGEFSIQMRDLDDRNTLHDITHENYDQYIALDMPARQHRTDLQQMHQVAAVLHREAATGDHEKREVKAERKAFAPGIEPVPGAAGRTLHPTTEDINHNGTFSDEGAMHAAMRSRPHDMTPRMVIADLYDDHDQPHTAALHRFVAEPTRRNFDTLAAYHEHPSEVADTVQAAATEHAGRIMPNWSASYWQHRDDPVPHPSRGAIPASHLRDRLDETVHGSAADGFHLSRDTNSARYAARVPLNTTHGILARHNDAYAAAHADPSTVADWGPDPIDETGHAFARTLHHAAAEAHRHARDYLTEQDALDKPERNDGPIPEGVWRHPRLTKSYTDDPAPHGYCPGCYSANVTERECPDCGPRIIPDKEPPV